MVDLIGTKINTTSFSKARAKKSVELIDSYNLKTGF